MGKARGESGTAPPFAGGERTVGGRIDLVDPPERFRAKLDRAGELLTTIHAELAAYYDSQPYAFRSERLDDPPRLVVTIESVQPPPPRLGVLMGEFVHDLRSALDHLVWQLALTRVAEPCARLQFPIYTARPRSGWKRVAADRLQDVPGAAVKMIERLQPYHSTAPQAAALAVVQALSNEDKHRLILETVTVPAEPDVSSFEVVGNMDVDEDMEISVPWGAPLTPGQWALTAHFTPIGPRPQVHLKGTLPVEVGFGTIGFRAAVMPGLAGEIVRHVRSFEGFFTP